MSLGSLLNPFYDLYRFESQHYVFNQILEVAKIITIQNNLERLIKAKTDNCLTDRCRLEKVNTKKFQTLYGKKLAYDTCSLYKTANSFYLAASTSGQDINPILLYYSFYYIHAALLNMVCLVSNPSPTHGLIFCQNRGLPNSNSSLKESEINKFINGIDVRIIPNGAFSRSKDLYTILGIPHMFCLINGAPGGTFQLNKEIRMPLKEVMTFDLKSDGFNPSAISYNRILLDYIYLFALSSIARYNSTVWRILYSGVGEEYPNMIKVLQRFPDNIRTLMELFHNSALKGPALETAGQRKEIT